MKQRNLLFVFLGVFMALLALVILQSNRPSVEATPEAQPSVNRLFNWGVQDIQAFSIRDPYTGATLSFQRDKNDTWQFLEMPDTKPTQESVNRIGLTVAFMPYLEVLDQVTSDSYPDFGLTRTDAFLILIALLKNGEQHTVIIGDVASGNVSHYALVDDRTTIYLVDARAVAFLVAALKQVYEPSATQEATTAP